MIHVLFQSRERVSVLWDMRNTSSVLDEQKHGSGSG